MNTYFATAVLALISALACPAFAQQKLVPAQSEALRARFLAAAHGCAQDVVIAGPDRPFPVALVVPNLAACRVTAVL